MLRLANGIWEKTREIFLRCGAGQDECVVLWTGPISQPELVDATLHPGHSKTPWNYRIDSSWLHQLHVSLYREQRSIRAQVHTHKGRAFHSATDDEYPAASVAGFVSIVLPRFAIGDIARRELWVSELDDNGRWVQADPSDAVTGWAL